MNIFNDMLDLDIPPETATEFLIRIGLYIGALFQFTYILAIIVLPEKPRITGVNGKATEHSDQESWDSQSTASNRQPAHRVRKQDKKKRR